MRTKRTISMLLGVMLTLCLISLPDTATAAENVPYIDIDGNEKIQDIAIELFGSADTVWEGGKWYVAYGSITIGKRINVLGDVRLILADGCTLTASDGIHLPEGRSLTIYGQSAGTGKLIANAKINYAAIGGNPDETGASPDAEGGGTITFVGGNVSVTGSSGAGIGGASGDRGIYIVDNGNGGDGGDGCDVTVYGGTVDVKMPYYAGAGIGGGAGGEGAAAGPGAPDGLNGGNGGDGGSLTIHGGSVTVTVDVYQTGVGGGEGANQGDGSVGTAGNGGDGANVIINGGSLTVVSQGVAIGGGEAGNSYSTSRSKAGDGGRLTMTGGELSAKSIQDKAIGGGFGQGGYSEDGDPAELSGFDTFTHEWTHTEGGTYTSGKATSFAADYASHPDVQYTSIRPMVIAEIGDVIVSGATGAAIAEKNVTVTLTNVGFQPSPQGRDVSAWFTNLPAGVTASLQSQIMVNATTATVAFSGTPTEAKNEAITATIPVDDLYSRVALPVTANSSAKWEIKKSIAFESLTVTDPQKPVTDELTLRFDEDFQWLDVAHITVTGASIGSVNSISPTVHTLSITDITVGNGGTVNVEVEKDGYIFTPTDRDVEVYDRRTITASAGAHGSISPSGSALVGVHGDQTFAFTPNDGYRVAGVTVDGVALVSPSTSYTFENVTADHTISVAFEAVFDPPESSNAITGITSGQVFTLGDTVSFTAVGGGMDVASPSAGDMRWHPSAWATNPSGDFDGDVFTQNFDTAGMSLGAHTLTVTFTKQERVGSAWVDLSPAPTDTKSVSFSLVAAIPPPTIDPPDNSPDRTETVIIGNRATFTVTDTNAVSRQWFKYTDDRQHSVIIVGATGTSYTTPPVTAENNDNMYCCVVVNSAGAATSGKFVLNVIESPVPPDTGDSSQPVLWLCVTLAAGALLTLTLALNRRKRRENQR